MKDAKMNKTSRGGFMAKGQCPDCGTTMCAMMSKDNAEKAMADKDAEKGFLIKLNLFYILFKCM